jgi:hypothetical protein
VPKVSLSSSSKGAGYRFPSSGSRLSRRAGLPKALTLKDTETLPTSLNGYPVGSKEEARVGVALSAIGWSYRYQVPIFGGREFRGGQVIDFVVETVPKPTPLFVNGVYWHITRGDADKELLERWVDAKMGAYWMKAKVVWDYQLRTVADALATVTLALGRP